MKIQPVVLAGGSGSRLWPVSREIYPKQLLQLTGGQSLLQTTLERVAMLGCALPPIIVVREEHRFVVRQQLDELGLFDNYAILLEPLGRCTAPAICGTTEYVRRESGEGTVMLVLPSDHLIDGKKAFKEAVKKAVVLAEKGRIVTFGVPIERVETGYGYIEEGAGSAVASFKEKPAVEQIREYIDKGNWFWNSGMFTYTVKTFQEEIARYAPEMQLCMVEAIRNGTEAGGFFCFDASSMADVMGTSIDYVLMEKTDRASVVPADINWRDVGSWQAMWEIMERDSNGNVSKGDVILESTRNSMVVAENKLVAAVGLTDTVVVETADAILVTSMSAVQEVKKVVHRLKKAGRDEVRVQRTVGRLWGSCATLETNKRFRINRLTIKPGAALSLQKHYHRYEHWIVVCGTAEITNGQDVFLLTENQSTYIPAGVIHRLENPGAIPLELIEIQIGRYLGEDDIVRYEDEEDI